MNPREGIIGILGGMGPAATVDLYDRIIKATEVTCDQDHLRVIIDSNPKIIDRTTAILNNDFFPANQMTESAKILQNSGVDFIVIPCISAHYFIERIRSQIQIPIISLIEKVGEVLSLQRPPIQKIGLLATTGTLRGAIFDKVFTLHKIQLLKPSDQDQKHLMEVIYEIKAKGMVALSESCKKKLISVVDDLVNRGVDGIVAGCTEIPLALSQRDLSVPFFDSLQILAEAAVKMARAGRLTQTRAPQ